MMMIPGTLLAIITYVTPNLIESLQLWPSAYSSPQTFQACIAKRYNLWKLARNVVKWDFLWYSNTLLDVLKHSFLSRFGVKICVIFALSPLSDANVTFFLQNNQREAELRKWLDLCFLAAGSEWHYYIRGKIARVTYFPSIIMVHEIFGVFLYTRNVNSLVKNDQKSERSTKTFIIFIDKKALKKLDWFLFSSWLNFGVANTVCY